MLTITNIETCWCMSFWMLETAFTRFGIGKKASKTAHALPLNKFLAAWTLDAVARSGIRGVDPIDDRDHNDSKCNWNLSLVNDVFRGEFAVIRTYSSLGFELPTEGSISELQSRVRYFYYRLSPLGNCGINRYACQILIAVGTCCAPFSERCKEHSTLLFSQLHLFGCFMCG